MSDLTAYGKEFPSGTLETAYKSLRGLEDLIPSIAAEAIPEIARLIEEQFEQGHDPYGKPWAPLRPATLAKGRHPPPLTDTGYMRESVYVTATSDGLRITVDGPSFFHQHGTDRMRARPILPDKQARLPESWERAIDDAAARAVAKVTR